MIRDYRLSELAHVCSATLNGEDRVITRVITDSRDAASGDLFVALRGERFDAHQFVSQVDQAGAAAAVVDSLQDSVGLSQLICEDTEVALGCLGRFNREQYKGRLVAVTGSAGKTTVKEMLALMLSARAPTLATQGNLNNEIGAPITLLRLAPEHQYAVVELGASGIGEIARTVAMAQPDVAILNNAMAAHVEGFGSLENIVRAKAEIYNGLKLDGTGIVNLDDPHAGRWLDYLRALQRSVLTFGVHPEADVRAVELKARADGCFDFCLTTVQGRWSFSLNVMGRHMVSNALAAVSAWVALGLDPADAIEPLKQYRGFKGRLQSHSLAGGMQLIDDSYNANPSAMRAAVDVLKTLGKPRTLVLGDMAELGEGAISEHASLGAYIAQNEIDHLLVTGPLMQHCAEEAAASGMDARHFETLEALLNALGEIKSASVLVKGSRSAGMDRVVTALLDRNG